VINKGEFLPRERRIASEANARGELRSEIGALTSVSRSSVGTGSSSALAFERASSFDCLRTKAIFQSRHLLAQPYPTAVFPWICLYSAASFTSIRRALNARPADHYIGGSVRADKKFVSDIDRIDALSVRVFFSIRASRALLFSGYREKTRSCIASTSRSGTLEDKTRAFIILNEHLSMVRQIRISRLRSF